MIKIAVLNSGDPNNRKGAFNNVHERIKHLASTNEVKVDAYLIQYVDSWSFQLLRKRGKETYPYSVIDGVSYKNIWVTHRIIDYIATYVLKIKDISCRTQLDQFVSLFRNYDLLSVHSLPDMYIAHLVKKHYGIPYVNTWHGSDINIAPFNNKKVFQTVQMLIEDANFNFFVSKSLLKTSNIITPKGRKSHLYTGSSDKFHRINNKEKRRIKKQYGIYSHYVVGFIGNLVPIKNVMLLPEIFNAVQKGRNDICFVIIGNGFLEKKLKQSLTNKGISNVKFMGKIAPEEMPELIHTIDVLVLPSKNEGLPRVTLEARNSGVHIVGSNVGGIPEVIGEQNTFPLDASFCTNISKRICQIISSNEECSDLDNEFSWEIALKKELSTYKLILDK